MYGLSSYFILELFFVRKFNRVDAPLLDSFTVIRARDFFPLMSTGETNLCIVTSGAPLSAFAATALCSPAAKPFFIDTAVATWLIKECTILEKPLYYCQRIFHQTGKSCLIQNQKSYDIVQFGYKCKNTLLHTP